jgi:transposase
VPCGTQLVALKEQILEFDRMIMAWHRSNQTSKRLHYIPGVGPMLATALVANEAVGYSLTVSGSMGRA